jgi:hypothetical protein
VILLAVTVSRCLLSRNGRGPRHPAAQKMIKDYQKTSKELKAFIDNGKVQANLPTLRRTPPWRLRPAL